MFVRFVPIKFNNLKNRKFFIKTVGSFFLLRLFPKSIAFLINLLPNFPKKHIFIRADCDHFGMDAYILGLC